RGHQSSGVPEHVPWARAPGAARPAGELRGSERLDGVEVLQEPASGEGMAGVPHRQRSRGYDPEPRLQHAVSQRPLQETHARDRDRSQAADPPGLPEDRRVLRPTGAVDHPDPGDREHVRLPGHDHQVLSRHGDGRRDQVGRGRVPPDLREAQAGMTARSPSGGPDAASARAAAVSVAVRARPRRGLAGQGARRLASGYLLLAPAVLYVLLLVGVPFLFSLFLALSDASVADTTASFVGLENFRAAFESDVFFIALRNSIGFTLVAAVFKGLLGTSLAFLLLQPFWGKKFIRGLVVIPFTLPISISVLGWKWMYDSQFSVINW